MPQVIYIKIFANSVGNNNTAKWLQKSDLLADEKGPHHLGQVVVCVIHLLIYWYTNHWNIITWVSYSLCNSIVNNFACKVLFCRLFWFELLWSLHVKVVNKGRHVFVAHINIFPWVLDTLTFLPLYATEVNLGHWAVH